MAIKELRLEPRPANRFAMAVVLLMLVPALLLFAAAAWLPAYGGLVQTVSLLLIAGGLFVAYKFVWVSYIYTVSDTGDGQPCLLVEERQGKRCSLVCRLPLRSILRIERVEKARSQPRGKAYVYTATMRGGVYYYITGRVDGTDILLKLELDDAFAADMRAAAEEARHAWQENE